MSILVVLKFFSLFFYAIEQHFVKIDGVPGGWAIAYYIFAVLKTGFFFVTITLIGTGWSFFKPFLSEKDKKIIMVVIPLQILDNAAMVIIGSTDQGSLGWFTWKNIFRLVDIICCGAVLIPIIWSIKHLREASHSDGKAARNLQKLRLFRQFYLIVVSYIYFTRIIVYLLDSTLQYYLVYLGDVFTELATLMFFLVVGYKFRPVQGNPYFNIEEDDAARMEEMHTAEEE
jgi:NADH:ubiquinone oxidoreductase subunit 3 (subunit A)